jgi:hypothetical protein
MLIRLAGKALLPRVLFEQLHTCTHGSCDVQIPGLYKGAMFRNAPN